MSEFLGPGRGGDRRAGGLNRLRIVAYGLMVVGIGLISAAGMLTIPSDLWLVLLTMGLGAVALGIAAMVLALNDSPTILFGLPFCVAFACDVAGMAFSAPGWFLTAASAAMFVALGGLLFAESGLSAIRRVRSRPRPKEIEGVNRQRIGTWLFQASFGVIFAGLVASQFGVVSLDVVIVTWLVVMMVSLLLGLRARRASLVLGLVSTVFAAFFIAALYVSMPAVVQDVMTALVIVWIAIMLLGPDMRERVARRRHRS